MMQKIINLVGLLVLAGATYLGLQLVQTQMQAERYRDKYEQKQQEYNQLSANYNQAITRTAVTELLVEDGRLYVIILTAAGELKRIDTPYLPDTEVYVDYAVLNGRIWIRRVFDSRTPPGQGVLINPELADIDWNAESAAYGKAVYRKLEPGRWIVTVTGDGSLGLAKATGRRPTELMAPPEVRDFAPTQAP